jgi:hypothetical protein
VQLRNPVVSAKSVLAHINNLQTENYWLKKKNGKTDGIAEKKNGKTDGIYACLDKIS